MGFFCIAQGHLARVHFYRLRCITVETVRQFPNTCLSWMSQQVVFMSDLTTSGLKSYSAGRHRD